ncbi:MAG: TrkA family potassium uptake protein [Acidimicrobiales bacterium]
MPRSSRRRSSSTAKTPVLVVGLGRFGGAVATELEALGFEVLGADTDAKRVHAYADELTHVVIADTSEAEVLRQLGAADFKLAVVGIGSDIEASILTTAALVDVGVPNIWAKAVTKAHGRILSRVGAHHVVYPEHEMGRRVAHLVGARIVDWFQLDADFAMVETAAPASLVGRPLSQLDLPRRHGVTVVCIKPAGGAFSFVGPGTVLNEGDLVVVAGPADRAEAFANLA